MSSGLQHKMYNYEVLPPAGVWEKIDAEIDESAMHRKYPSLLRNSQVTPPVHAWNRIAAALDEVALVTDYGARLAAIEIAPPATVWNKINTSLDGEKEILLSARRRIFPFLRYAAAAAVIALVAFGALQLLKPNKGNQEIVSKQMPASKEIETPIPAIKEQNTSLVSDKIIAAEDETRNDAALEASKKTLATLNKPSSTKMDIAAGYYFEHDIVTGTTRGLDEYFVPPQDDPPGNPSAGRYIILMTPDGNIIRMSKKLSDLVCCVSGEEQDEECIDQIKKWRKKIADSPANQSPGNFMDILSLVSSLQEAD